VFEEKLLCTNEHAEKLKNYDNSTNHVLSDYDQSEKNTPLLTEITNDIINIE
jgi:hypothetical protein